MLITNDKVNNKKVYNSNYFWLIKKRFKFKVYNLKVVLNFVQTNNILHGNRQMLSKISIRRTTFNMNPQHDWFKLHRQVALFLRATPKTVQSQSTGFSEMPATRKYEMRAAVVLCLQGS